MKKIVQDIILRVKWQLCLWLARWRVAATKRKYPELIGATNAWPTTGAGSLATGYLASGVTTIRWGSGELVTSINATAVNGTTVAIVMRFNQSNIVDNMKFPNGNGVSITRVMIVDGVKWDCTIRDDTGITNRPKIGTTVVIVDAGGLIDVVAEKYSAVVVESGYDAAPKQPGEITFTVENLVLIESQTGT